jgi:hypothetical protein
MLDIDIISEPPPPAPPPDVCIESVGIFGQKEQEAIHCWLELGCHIFVPSSHAPHPPPPQGKGQSSKSVILPTSDPDTQNMIFPQTIITFQ